MCDPDGQAAEIYLGGYNSITSAEKPLFISATHELQQDCPNESFSNISKRKRRGSFDPIQLKNFKVRRKCVEKIHLQIEPMDLSMLTTEPNVEAVENTIFAEDDDTEKYLTNSTKSKSKHKKTVSEAKSMPSVASHPNTVVSDFDSTNMHVVTDYGDLVVSLFPNEDGALNKEQNANQISTSTHGSYLKDDHQNQTFYINQDLLDANTNTEEATVCPTMVQSKNSASVNISRQCIGEHGDSMIAEQGLTSSPPVSVVVNSTSAPAAKRQKNKTGSYSVAVESNKDPVRNVWVTMRSHKEQMKQEGLKWTTGTWSKEEVDILERNIDKYCNDHRIDNLEELIFSSSKDTRKDFYPSLCTGLNRPLFAVYRRVKRMYNKRNHRGKYTEEEVDKLKRLRNIHGHNWSLIGQELGRSSDSVKDRCRLIKEDLTTGRWTKCEEDKLSQAVHLVTSTRIGESVTENISWGRVATMVESRTEKQCRSKWLNYLNWKTMHGEPWTKNDDKLLVEKVAKQDASSENEIEWSQLSSGWTSARSPQWLRWKWNSLKKQLSDLDIENLTFKQTVEILLKFYSDQVLSGWEKPSQLIKFLKHKNPIKFTSSDMERLQVLGIRILSKEDLEDASSITTTVVSQSEDTTSAPLFIQTGDAEQMVTSTAGLSESSSDVDAPFRFRITSADAANESNKSEASYESSPSGPTYHIASTSSDGICIIETSNSPDEVSTLSADGDRYVSFTLAPELLSSMLKLNGSRLQADDGVTSSDGDVNFDPSVESVYLSQSPDSPVLEAVARDVTIGSPSTVEEDTIVLLRDANPLPAEVLLD